MLFAKFSLCTRAASLLKEVIVSLHHPGKSTTSWPERGQILFTSFLRLTGFMIRKSHMSIIADVNLLNLIHRCGQNQPYRKQALMHCEDGKVILNFSRRSLTGSPTSPRPAHIPGITEIQAEALDMVQHLAEKHQLVTTMQPGDMRFINNFGILHARDRFKDGIGSKRHLLRLWLRTERGGWKLPLPLHNAMDSIFNSSDTSMQKWEADPVLTTDQVTTAVDTCS